MKFYGSYPGLCGQPPNPSSLIAGWIIYIDTIDRKKEFKRSGLESHDQKPSGISRQSRPTTLLLGAA